MLLSLNVDFPNLLELLQVTYVICSEITYCLNNKVLLLEPSPAADRSFPAMTHHNVFGNERGSSFCNLHLSSKLDSSQATVLV